MSAEHEITLTAVRDAIARLHWQELTARKPDENWLKALTAAARDVKKRLNGHG